MLIRLTKGLITGVHTRRIYSYYARRRAARGHPGSRHLVNTQCLSRFAIEISVLLINRFLMLMSGACDLAALITTIASIYNSNSSPNSSFHIISFVFWWRNILLAWFRFCGRFRFRKCVRFGWSRYRLDHRTSWNPRVDVTYLMLQLMPQSVWSKYHVLMQVVHRSKVHNPTYLFT